MKMTPIVGQHSEKRQLIYHLSIGQLMLGFLFFLPFSFFLVGTYKQELTHTYLFYAALVVFLGVVFMVYDYFQNDSFDFYETYFTTYKWRSKNERKLLYEDVVKYQILEKHQKRKTWEVLYFETKDKQRFEISSDVCADPKRFKRIQELLLPKAELDTYLGNIMTKKGNLKNSTWYIVFGIVLLAANYFMTTKIESLTEEGELVPISGTVDSVSQVRQSRSTFNDVALKEYPNLIFRIDHVFQGVLVERLETTPINSGTAVNMLIKSTDYRNKMTKHPTESGYIKALQYVEVYTLSNPHSHVVYLSLDEYKTVRADSEGDLISMMGELMTFIGIITVLYNGFYLLYYSNNLLKTKNSI